MAPIPWLVGAQTSRELAADPTYTGDLNLQFQVLVPLLDAVSLRAG